MIDGSLLSYGDPDHPGLPGQPSIHFESFPMPRCSKLDDLGLYRVGLAYRGQPEREFPTGWSGPFDEQTGMACQPVGIQNGRQAFCCTVPGGRAPGSLPGVSHPASRARRAVLRGATAPRRGRGEVRRRHLSDHGWLAKTVDVHRTDASWQDFEYDLSGAAGTGAGPPLRD